MESIVVDPLSNGNRPDARLASLSRRLTFAGDSWFFYDRIFCSNALRRLARIGDSQTARVPDHATRIAFDLLECIRTGSVVSDIGNPELAMLDADGALPQHPRYRGYWYDPALHSSVGMFLGIDLIHYRDRYYFLEFNHGPSIYPRRRTLYDTPYDPFVSGIVTAAKEGGFERVVPIAFRWDSIWVDEFTRAGRELGLTVVPTNCPLEVRGVPRMLALPTPLEPKTMYVIHSGLWTPVCRYLDNKWYTSKWLGEAFARDLPRHTKVAMPETRDSFFFPDEEHGERWPNLVVKLAGGAASTCVITGRFDDEADARRTLGLTSGISVPRQLRVQYARSLLFSGRERVMYQAFIPPELDERGHPQLVRLHLLVTPTAATFLSAHYRVSRRQVPERVPRGIIGRDEAFIFNDCDYQRLPDAMERELRGVVADVGPAVQREIARKFQTS